MKRTLSTLMIVLAATLGLSVISAADANAGGKHRHHKRHHHRHHWDWDHHRGHHDHHRSARRHVHSAHCGHGYYDSHGVFRLYGHNGGIELNLGGLFFGHR